MGFPNAQMAVHFRVEMTLLGAQVVTEPPMPPSRRARVIREVVVKPAAADAAPPRRAVTMAEKLAALDARANEEPEEEPEEGAEQGAEEEEEEADAAQAESSYDRAEEVARQQQQDALDREAAHLAQIDSRANQQLNRVNSYPGQLPPASGGGVLAGFGAKPRRANNLQPSTSVPAIGYGVYAGSNPASAAYYNQYAQAYGQSTAQPQQPQQPQQSQQQQQQQAYAAWQQQQQQYAQQYAAYYAAQPQQQAKQAAAPPQRGARR